MTYKDGTEVREGDVILVAHGDGSHRQGTIKQILRAGTQDAIDLAVPNGGVLIEGAGFGLMVTEHIGSDEDIFFVRRRDVL
jgi:hypothetical protein